MSRSPRNSQSHDDEGDDSVKTWSDTDLERWDYEIKKEQQRRRETRNVREEDNPSRRYSQPHRRRAIRDTSGGYKFSDDDDPDSDRDTSGDYKFPDDDDPDSDNDDEVDDSPPRTPEDGTGLWQKDLTEEENEAAWREEEQKMRSDDRRDSEQTHQKYYDRYDECPYERYSHSPRGTAANIPHPYMVAI